ncbi:MAG: hypothetical protein ACRENO_04575 [Thermodesulfobacteriota bacterium]
MVRNISDIKEVISLFEVLRILRNEENRKARRVIYESYLKFEKNKIFNVFQKPEMRNYIDLVKGDFDEIGFLMYIGLLKQEPFFDLYSDTVRRLWLALKQNIIFERKLRRKKTKSKDKSKQFMKYFEYLANQAKKYRDSKHLSEPEIIDLSNL